MQSLKLKQEQTYLLATSIIKNMLDINLITEDEYFDMIQVIKDETFAMQN